MSLPLQSDRLNQTYNELFACQNYTEAAGQPLATYANTTYGTIVTYFQWNNLGAPWFGNCSLA